MYQEELALLGRHNGIGDLVMSAFGHAYLTSELTVPRGNQRLLSEGRLHAVCLKPHKLEVLPIDFYRFDQVNLTLRGSGERNEPRSKVVRSLEEKNGARGAAPLCLFRLKP